MFEQGNWDLDFFGNCSNIIPMPTRCTLIKLKPGSLPKVRDWAEHLKINHAEVLKTLEQEGVTVESAFLYHAADADYLVYYMRCEDFEKSVSAFKKSEYAIDAYHKKFKEEAWESRTQLELLLDASRS
ncbi:MAG TPA: DUF6176 family protein [Alphaproteobacteria bacterium]|nr:DUF6176 family protein [Alphaproteobacteria bacterium]